MRLYLSSMRRQAIPALIVGIIYVVSLMLLIKTCNSNSVIYYQISPYEYASKSVDFFFCLIVSIPFSVYTFYMKKDNFLEYVHLRMSKNKYVRIHIFSTLIICFLMVLVVNIIGVVFSCDIANVVENNYGITLNDYILGGLQMSNPIVFGILWSFYKSLIGVLICLFAQIIALYVDNLFLALIAPLAYVILENYFTSIFKIPKFSLTTTFVLNRLAPRAMEITNIAIGSICFVVVIVITRTVLRSRLISGKM